MHRLIAIVATLLLSASALAHAPRASVGALPFGEPTQAAQRIEAEAASPEPHALENLSRQQKTAHPARARLIELERPYASALTHCLVLENWLFGWKCASGTTVNAWGVVIDQAGEQSKLGHTGYQREVDDSYQAIARWYRPGIGRFQSMDPIDGDPMMPATLNEYLAFNGNPTVYVDPDGRCAIPSLCAFGYARNNAERVTAMRSFANTDPSMGRTVGVAVRTGQMVMAPVNAATTTIAAIQGDTGARATVANTAAAAGDYAAQRVMTLATDGVAGLLRQDVTDFGTSMGENAGEMVVAGQRGDYVGQGMAGADFAGQVAAVVPVLRATSLARANVARAGIEGTKPIQLTEAPDGSVGVRFNDVDGEAGVGQIEHPVAQSPRHGDFHGPWREPPDDNFDWKAYLERESGTTAPAGMPDPHAHHVLQKRGRPGTQRDLVLEGQDLLQRRAGIDPIYGLENLVWAPNRVKGQHSTETLRRVVSSIRELDSVNAAPQDFLKALEELGKEAADRR